MTQGPRRVQQTPFGQSVNRDFGDAQINGCFRAFESLLLDRWFRVTIMRVTIASCCLLGNLTIALLHTNLIQP
jgi:hypothetical protein